MSDTTSDITQDFVNKLSEVKESLTESRVISFSDFMRIKEDFDTEAFNKAAKSSASGTTKKKEGEKKEGEKKEGEKKEEGGKTPFECAKEAKGAKIVDIENGKTKVVIGKTSFYDNGRKKNPEGKMENYDCNDPLFKQEEVSPEGIEESLIKASEKIVELFGDASFWQPFKGSINDDEDAAAAEFDKWWKTSIERKYLNPATSKMENMGDSEDKQTLSDNIETLKGAKDKIRKKLKGDTDDDTFSWKIYKLDGETENYKIDTDF
jgi:hypothetical protein